MNKLLTSMQTSFLEELKKSLPGTTYQLCKALNYDMTNQTYFKRKLERIARKGYIRRINNKWRATQKTAD